MADPGCTELMVLHCLQVAFTLPHHPPCCVCTKRHVPHLWCASLTTPDELEVSGAATVSHQPPATSCLLQTSAAPSPSLPSPLPPLFTPPPKGASLD
jgi:hypothetical protein